MHNCQQHMHVVTLESHGHMQCVVCRAVLCCAVSGEEPHSGIVASISSDNPALVTCVDDERLEFQVSDKGEGI